MHPHEVEEIEMQSGPRLWDATPGVCCAAFQLGACSHTEDYYDEYHHEPKVGDRVRIYAPAGHVLWTTKWWPAHADHTGTLTKIYKNGRGLVAVDQFRNRSADGRVTMNLELELLEVIG